MRPLRRVNQNKSKASSTFKRHVGHTKAVNVAPPPQRGGYRL